MGTAGPRPRNENIAWKCFVDSLQAVTPVGFAAAGKGCARECEEYEAAHTIACMRRLLLGAPVPPAVNIVGRPRRTGVALAFNLRYIGVGVLPRREFQTSAESI